MKKSELKTLVEEQKVEIKELETKTVNAESNLKYARNSRDKAVEELEQLHLLFDGLENNPREVEILNGYGKTTLTLTTRFCRYLQGLVIQDTKHKQLGE